MRIIHTGFTFGQCLVVADDVDIQFDYVQMDEATFREKTGSTHPDFGMRRPNAKLIVHRTARWACPSQVEDRPRAGLIYGRQIAARPTRLPRLWYAGPNPEVCCKAHAWYSSENLHSWNTNTIRGGYETWQATVRTSTRWLLYSLASWMPAWPKT